MPFYIRAGKRLAATATEVLIEFRQPPRLFFARSDADLPHANHLLFRLEPGERVSASVQIKKPGEQLHSRPVDLVYDFDERVDGPREEAYARARQRHGGRPASVRSGRRRARRKPTG